MKKVTLLCGMLLALTATVASAAQGVNIRWQACLGDLGTFNRNFACNTNNGSNILVGSFELAADIADVSGNEIVVDIATAGPALPAWWQFRNAGTCRTTALSMNTSVSPAAVNCFDWANAQATGGIGAYIVGVAGANTARVVAASAVPVSALAGLSAATEYFSFNLLISNAKTVGLGACAGCLTPACIVFNSVNLTTPIAANNRKLTGVTNGTDSDFCVWQGGGGGIQSPRGEGCGGSTPTRNATWGSVKSLYR